MNYNEQYNQAYEIYTRPIRERYEDEIAMISKHLESWVPRYTTANDYLCDACRDAIAQSHKFGGRASGPVINLRLGPDPVDLVIGIDAEKFGEAFDLGVFFEAFQNAYDPYGEI